MNELRWILLGASVALFAWIVWQGRRKTLATLGESAKQHSVETPQLSDRVVMKRERQLEPAVLVARESQRATDDLPEVRIAPTSGPLSIDAALSTAALDRLTITQPLNEESESNIPIAPAPSVVAAKVLPQSPSQPVARSAVAPATRKVVVLRVAVIERRFDGARLKDLFFEQGLRHGRYGIFHRADAHGGTLFSAASMVEPGTFDLGAMPTSQYPGVSLFLQLPSYSDGLVAFEAMLSCAQALQQEFQASLLGERGKVLTPEIITRMREEIADFQHLLPPLVGG